MTRSNPTPIGLVATGVAWSVPAIAAVGIICPPALLAIPAAGGVAAFRAGSRRQARRIEAEKAAADMEANWARWSQLDPTSERGY